MITWLLIQGLKGKILEFKNIDTTRIVLEIEQVISELQPLAPLNKGGPQQQEAHQIANRNIALVSSALERYTLPNSSYKKNLSDILTKYNLANYSQMLDISSSVTGLLQALKFDYSNGYLTTVEQQILSDTFSDFMEMSKHLIDSGYHIPAAVLVGGVLEENLRKLCLKNDIKITRLKEGKEIALQASVMSENLTKAGLYKSTTQKLITAWLGIRNSAAHGKYDDFTKEQVNNMYQGVLQFLNDYLF